MKTLYSILSRLVFSTALFFSLQQLVKAQPTTLVAGDIAFTGYHGATMASDSFSFVLLKAVNAGTQINFTDNGWLNPGVFRVGESHLQLTTIALPAGREIVIGLLPGTTTARQQGNGASAGTVTYTAGPNPMAFATSGDQVFAYQGTIASPTFISGIHMNIVSMDISECGNTTDASWDPDCFDGAGGTVGNTNFSKLPPGLISGTNALLFPTPVVNASDRDNAKFGTCGVSLTTAAQVRAAVNNRSNWTVNNNTNPPGFLLGANCAFMGLFPLPIKLISFTGKLNANKTATLQWKVAEQQDILRYEVEESNDGIVFRNLGTVAPGIGDTYSFPDAQLLPRKNYYRLKMVELNDKISYSKVISLDLKDGIVVSLYPNPVTELLTIQYFGTTTSKKAVLSDITGKVFLQLKLVGGEQTINMQKMAAGIYLLKLEDGSTYKIIKE